MTYYNKWMFNDFGVQIYNEDGSKTKYHPEFKSSEIDLSKLNFIIISYEEWLDLVNKKKSFIIFEPTKNNCLYSTLFIKAESEIALPFLICKCKYHKKINSSMVVTELYIYGLVKSDQDIVAIKSAADLLTA